MPTFRDAVDFLGMLKSAYGWGWAVSAAAGILLASLVVGGCWFYFWRHRPLLREASKFNPSSLVVDVYAVDLLDPASTDPIVGLQLRIQNVSGRRVVVTGIKGEINCQFGAGLGPARLLRESVLQPDSDSVVSVSQVFSHAVAQKITDTLRSDGIVAFGLGGLKLLGRVDRAEVELPIHAPCWVKGPFVAERRANGRGVRDAAARTSSGFVSRAAATQSWVGLNPRGTAVRDLGWTKSAGHRGCCWSFNERRRGRES
jgi:hypothetical protein